MKISVLLFILCFITACGKAKMKVINSESPITATLDFSVDMTDIEDNYYYFLATNSASYQKTAIGTFEIDGADGMSFLGFPTEVSEYYPLSASSSLSFHSQRQLGSTNDLKLTLFVDSGCDGAFDAIVSFNVNPNTTYALAQTTAISSISNGSLVGISAGSPFSSLNGKCLINSEINDPAYPANKKLAGLMITVGSNVSYEISDVDIRF